MRAAASFVQAMGNLANTTRTLIEQEHEAHGVDNRRRGTTESLKDINYGPPGRAEG